MSQAKPKPKDMWADSNPLEIKAERLKEKLDKGEEVFILDVRTPEEHNAWNLSYDKYQNTPVIPIDKIIDPKGKVSEQIPKDKEIVTLCAHGQRSQMAAQALSKMGYNVRSIKGGMTAWNQVYDVARVPLDTSKLKVWQLRRISKGCMAYVIASGNNATVIDSTCDLDSSVLHLAEENRLKIVNVVDTHMHADHVSGLAALAKKTGANPYLGSKEGYEQSKGLGIKPNMIGDGDRIPLGNGIPLLAIHTPGHTEGSMCFLLKPESKNGKNYIFTGDSLFVNGVGRPDLHNKAKEFATNLYATYHEVLLKYPEDTMILPAHFDNSITVKHEELITDTIGSIRKKVSLLSMPKKEFVDFMVAAVPPRPANYEKIIQINRQLIPCEQVNMGNLEEGPNSCAIRM